MIPRSQPIMLLLFRSNIRWIVHSFPVPKRMCALSFVFEVSNFGPRVDVCTECDPLQGVVSFLLSESVCRRDFKCAFDGLLSSATSSFHLFVRATLEPLAIPQDLGHGPALIPVRENLMFLCFHTVHTSLADMTKRIVLGLVESSGYPAHSLDITLAGVESLLMMELS